MNLLGAPRSYDDLLAANVLATRIPAARDTKRESRALDLLIGRLNASPATALQALVETVIDLCASGSAGVSILEGDRFVWPAIAGQWARYFGQGLPRDASPCGLVIDRNAALLFDQPQLLFPESAGEPEVQEILLVPLLLDGQPRGTLWLLSHDGRRFDGEDVRILERMALIATAIETTRRSRESEEQVLRNARDRVRNTVAVLRMLVRRSDNDRLEPDLAPLAKLSSRLAAFAEGAIGAGRTDSVSLWPMIAHLLVQRGEEPDRRVTLSGPEFSVPVRQAGPLALALHELLENALEHGALAHAAGRVHIRWWMAHEAETRSLHVGWIEKGIGASIPDTPPHRGFGFELLLDGLPELMSARTEIRFEPAGLEFALVMPLPEAH
ncbi:GAF domain-containing protein [Novosphingobium kaempferiae]|uniref:GAF domain-containing protein n=1 Tax=Novosphingobium kaempferiae TaxID=2896849 RepID=UPI001E608E32|nr:GAF domain-containing protein [Novosphingobium kaempferiae]